MRLFVITGTCGAGKSTMKDYLSERLDTDRFVCVDSDEVGLNWWDYAGTDHEEKYGEDTLKGAVKMAGGKDLVFVSCLNPLDYFQKIEAPSEIETSFFIALCPTDEEIDKRLKARPTERGFTSDEIIKPHIEYNKWFRKNRSKFQMFIDNTEISEDETADRIAAFIENI
ncbi:MAG: AAA family ATPase [Lachnospiraceae bacterium]|nr:AAA family ATPase [Lachnospiraceae bacterium]